MSVFKEGIQSLGVYVLSRLITSKNDQNVNMRNELCARPKRRAFMTRVFPRIITKLFAMFAVC